MIAVLLFVERAEAKALTERDLVPSEPITVVFQTKAGFVTLKVMMSTQKDLTISLVINIWPMLVVRVISKQYSSAVMVEVTHLSRTLCHRHVVRASQLPDA